MNKEFLAKLVRVQGELKAPKGQYNKFGGYAYRSAEDILEAVKPLLNREGLLMTINDEIQLIGDRYYVKATVTVTDGEGSVTTAAYAREPENKKGMDECQITGATSSYARKYALNAMYAIDDNKDADTDEYAQQTGRQQKQPQKQPQKPQQAPKPQQQGNQQGTTKATPEQILQRFSDAIKNINDEAEVKEVYTKCWNMLPAGDLRKQCQDYAQIRIAEIKSTRAFKE